jgi:hypothetical protein
MIYPRSAFIAFPADAGQVAANLEAAYEQWAQARQTLASLPMSMFWQAKGQTEYLAVKQNDADSGTTKGARSAETEAVFERFVEAKALAKARAANADDLIGQRAGQYRALRLPVMLDKQGELLRALDVAGLLRNDLLVVGTNAFVAYELLCGVRFPAGNEPTQDFDLAWCRGSSVSLAQLVPDAGVSERKTLLAVLRSIDASYSLNPKKPYQAINAAGYEVELLAAPSRAPLPRREGFEPVVSLVEQEWLLQGRAATVVVATQRHRACPLYVPDPRWMAMHKLWLAQKPERNAQKRPKDARQGEVLLSAVRYFLPDAYPLDLDFVTALPEELRDLFHEWAQRNGFDPTHPG